MRITRPPPRRMPKLPQIFHELHADLLAEPLVLEKIPTDWKYPKDDLHHWTGILNRFDTILGELANKYIKKDETLTKQNPKDPEKWTIQHVPFEENDRQTLLRILVFERLLVENCTNRSLFNSYEHLDALMNTSDLDILEAVLRLMIRPAHRFGGSRNTHRPFSVNMEHLLAFSHTFGTNDKGYNYAEMLSDEWAPGPEMQGFNFQFYREAISTPNKSHRSHLPYTTPAKRAAPVVPSPTPGKKLKTRDPKTPTKPPRELAEGRVVIRSLNMIPGQSPFSATMALIDEYKPPQKIFLRLYHAVRSEAYLSDKTLRIKLLKIKIYACTLLAYTLTEDEFNSRHAIYEPDLIDDLAELVQPAVDIDHSLATAVYSAFDAMSYHRGKLHSLLSATCVSAGHGALFFRFRNAIGSIMDGDDIPRDYLDSLFSLITHMASTNTGGQMMITAGIIPLLLSMVPINMAILYKSISKAIHILDTLLYTFESAYAVFNTANGLQTIVERIQALLQTCVDSEAEEENGEVLGWEVQLLFKSLFKFLLHLYNTSIGQDRLRNLVESQLPKHLQLVFDHPNKFTPNVFAFAANVMTAMIHLEPTCLTILQEHGLPQAFMNSVKKEVALSADVIAGIPSAFGALCLNQAGLDNFMEIKPLHSFFCAFGSAESINIFQDVDSCVNVGNGVDELMRHHPQLKADTMEEVIDLIKRLLRNTETYEASNAQCGSQNRIIPIKNKNEDVDMDTAVAVATAIEETEYTNKDWVPVIHLILHISRFLEGLTSNPLQSKELAKAENCRLLFQIYRSQSLPPDFSLSPACLSMNCVFKTMYEASPETFSNILIEIIANDVKDLVDFINSKQMEGFCPSEALIPLENDPILTIANEFVHKMTVVHNLLKLLSETCNTFVYAQAMRATYNIAVHLSTEQGRTLISNIGLIQRWSVSEQIRFYQHVSPAWLPPKSKNRTCRDVSVEQELTASINPLDIRARNTRTMLTLLVGMSDDLMPLLQGICKLCFTKRVSDPTLRRQSLLVCNTIAAVLKQHITWPAIQSKDTQLRFAYHAMAVYFCRKLICDERYAGMLVTPMAWGFLRNGSVVDMFDLLYTMWTPENLAIVASPPARTQAQVHFALNIISEIAYRMCCTKSVTNSSHTAHLIVKEKSNVEVEDPFVPEQFLLQARLEVLTKTERVWKSPLLVHCPLPTIRNITNCLSEIYRAESEIVLPKKDTTSSEIANGVRSQDHASAVQTLLDMGFTATQAERALQQNEGQVPRAARWLLTAGANEINSNITFGTAPGSSTDTPKAERDKSPSKESGVVAPSSSQKQALDSKRDSLRDKLVGPAFEVLMVNEETVFTIADLISVDHNNSSVQLAAIQNLLDWDIIEADLRKPQLEPDTKLCRQKALLRLLGIITSSVKTKECQDFLKQKSLADHILSALSSVGIAVYNEEKHVSILWSRMLLLWENYCRATTFYYPGGAKAPFSLEQLRILETSCFTVLSAKLDNTAISATLRFLMMLTRNDEIAHDVQDEDSIRSVLSVLKPEPTTQPSYAIFILRRFFESYQMLQTIFEREIEQSFSTKRITVMDSKMFMKQHASLAVRNYEAFHAACVKTLKIANFGQPGKALQLSLIETDPADGFKKPKTEVVEPSQTDDKTPPVATVQPEISLSEQEQSTAIASLLNVFISYAKSEKEIIEPHIEPTEQERADAIGLLWKRCNLLHYLTELAINFPAARYSIINFVKKRPNKDSSKQRNVFIHHLLHDLLPYKTISSAPDLADVPTRQKLALSVCVQGLITALCHPPPPKEADIVLWKDVVYVKHTNIILDAIHRAFKDAMVTSYTMESRYCKLLALSDLLYKVLAKPIHNTNAASGGNITLHVAKLMLDKDYVKLLASVIGHLDLNHPQIKIIVTAVLRPIEMLGKIANKLSKTSDILDTGKAPTSELAPLIDEPHQGDDSGDIVRNSALGLHSLPNGDESETDLEDEEGMFVEEDGYSEYSTDSSMSDADPEDDMQVDDELNIDDDEDDDDDDDEDDDDEEEDDDDQDDHNERSHEMSDSGESHSEADLMHEEIHHHHDHLDNPLEGLEDQILEDIENAANGQPIEMLIDNMENGEQEEEDGDDPMMDGDEMINFEITQDGEDGDPDDPDRMWTSTGEHSVAAMFHQLVNGVHNNFNMEDEEDEEDTFEINAVEDIAERSSQFDDEEAALVLRAGGRSRFLPPAGTLHFASDQARVHIQVTDRSSVPMANTNNNNSSNPLLRENAIIGSYADVQPTRIRRDASDEDMNGIQELASNAMQWLGQFLIRPGNRPPGMPPNFPAETMTTMNPRHVHQNQNDPHRIITSWTITMNARCWSDEANNLLGAQPFSNEINQAIFDDVCKALTPAAEEEYQKRKEAEAKLQAERKIRQEKAAAKKAEQDAAAALVEEARLKEEQAAKAAREAEAAAMDVDRAEAPQTATEAAPNMFELGGMQFNLTALGFDREALMELPEDMRLEVLQSQTRELRLDRPSNNTTAGPANAPTDSIYDPEVLSALPDDIREEVLLQERRERARNREARGPPVNDSIMDPAAFLAALTPGLNSLSDTDALLTRGGMAHDLQTMRSRMRPLHEIMNRKGAESSRHQHRDAIQLLDRTSIAAITNLLFVPSIGTRTTLHKLLGHLAQNSKARQDISHILISIIYDTSGDDALERHLHPAQRKPVTPGSTLAQGNINAYEDQPPHLVLQRGLEAMSALCTVHRELVQYLLSPNEITILVRSAAKSRKGKGKDLSTVQKFPVIALFHLVEREAFSQHTMFMDLLMQTLSIVLSRLPSMVENKHKAELAAEVKSDDPKSPKSPKSPKPLEAPKKSEDSAAPVTADQGGQTVQKATASESKPNALKPEIILPVIPDDAIQKIIDVLTSGECSNKSFQSILNILYFINTLPNMRQGIIEQLANSAKMKGKSLEGELSELDVTIRSGNNADLQSLVLAKFSLTGNQSRLLRLLKTLDFLHIKRKKSGKATPDQDEPMPIYAEFQFDLLWKHLSSCLMAIQDDPKHIHVATVLLPATEAFMVVLKHVKHISAADTKPLDTRRTSISPSNQDDPFMVFTDQHRRLLNVLIRENPGLMIGSFSLLVKNPKMLEFDNKRTWFTQQLHKKPKTARHVGTISLQLRRDHVFDDTYSQFLGRSGDEIKYGKLNIRFTGEEGVDAGGVTREWYTVLARSMFNPDYALFINKSADKTTYQPNKDSGINPHHLSYFKFVGRVIGKAIYDGRQLDAYFTRSFYKHILRKPVNYKDLESVDLPFYKSVEWMLTNDVSMLDETFSTEHDYFGQTSVIDLKPDGRNIPVTNENKHEYVRLLTESHLTTNIQEQIEAFNKGFNDVISQELIDIFDEQELELLISGLPDIDIDDWKLHTTYNGYSATSPPVQWFWRAVRTYTQEEKAKLLQFVSGTSKVPLDGFKELQGSNGIQKFSIHKDPGSTDRLPTAHTCFNQLDLPAYESYEQLSKHLWLAISECGVGFGFI